MYPIETYARLYDEVVEREDGKDVYDPVKGTVWNERGPAEQRMVRAGDEALWEAFEAYADNVSAFDRVHNTIDALPEERGEAYSAALPDNRTGRVASPWKHFTTGEDTIWIRYWVTYNIDPISSAEDAAQFERKLRDNLEQLREHDTHTTRQMEAVYDGWDESNEDWAEDLWAFVTDEDLALKELAEERTRHNHEIADRAKALETELGARLEEHMEQSSWWKRVKDRLL